MIGYELYHFDESALPVDICGIYVTTNQDFNNLKIKTFGWDIINFEGIFFYKFIKNKIASKHMFIAMKVVKWYLISLVTKIAMSRVYSCF